MDKHTFTCMDCGEKWEGAMENPAQFGTYDPCPHCLSVLGSFHDCCEDEQHAHRSGEE